jgi:hypothetical protein
MSFEALGKVPAGKSRILVGWDPASRQVRFLSVWSDGSLEELVLSTREGTAFLGTYSTKTAAAAPQQARIRADYVDADTCILTFLDGPNKGKQLSTWKRQAASDQRTGPTSSAPALLKEYAALMVGQWECKSAVPWVPVPGIGTVPARGTCSWTLDGAALQWSLQIGEANTLALVGWDSDSKRLREFVVTSTGDCFLVFVTKEGDKWVTTAELTMPDGKRKAIRAVTTFDNNGNRHVNEYPTHKDVFTRVPTK